jgi:hypothetical protein
LGFPFVVELSFVERLREAGGGARRDGMVRSIAGRTAMNNRSRSSRRARRTSLATIGRAHASCHARGWFR